MFKYILLLLFKISFSLNGDVRGGHVSTTELPVAFSSKYSKTYLLGYPDIKKYFKINLIKVFLLTLL
jgi:hypothetical protein